MQLGNVLRDVREDLARGRRYLPREDLDRFGCTDRDLAGPGDQRTRSLIRFEVARAESWFTRGLRLLPLLDRRSAACAGAMAGIYRRLLRRIAAQPDAVLGRRLSLPGWEKAAVAARALAGMAG
jgi:phytoene synthase